MKSIYFAITVFSCLFALGCAGDGGGGEQNYKVLEEDREMFRTEEKRPTSMREAKRVLALRGESSSDAVATTQPEEAPSPGPAVDPDLEELDAALSDEAPANSTDPAAGTVLDRSNWTRIKVGAADGSVRHNPIYWRDCPTDDTYVKVRTEPRQIPKLEAALANPYAGNWNATNALGSVAQPVKFGVDIVLLPVKLFTEGHPWSEQTSPKK